MRPPPPLMRPLLALLAALAAAAPLAGAQDTPPDGVPSVVVGLSVDGSADARLVQGRPALITAHVVHARAFQPEAAPVALAPSGSWVSALRLTVDGADGRPVDVAFEPAGGPGGPFEPGPVTVTGDGGAAWSWALTADASAGLPPGPYTLRLTLDGGALGGADVVGPPVRLTVEPAPAAPTANDRAETALRLADVAAALGRPAEALAALGGLVAEQPFHVGARLRQALLLEAERPVAALEAALYAVEGLPEGRGAEPPALLLALQDRLAHAADAATAFEVTLAEKPPTHPDAGRGPDRAFALDGIAGREVVLRRGVTYTFRLSGVPAEAPFWIATDPAGAEPYATGVEGAPASGDGVLTFTPGDDTPAVLYYGSAAAPFAGARLFVESDRATPAEPGGPDAPTALTLSAPAPNPTAARAVVALTTPFAGPVTVEAFDVLGRRVAVLHDGPAPAGDLRLSVDTSGWPAGTYVVRAVAGDGVAVRRLTVVR